MIYLVTEFIGMYSGAAVVALDLSESLARSEKELSVIRLGDRIPNDRAPQHSGFRLLKMPYVTDRENYPKGVAGSIRYMFKKTESDSLHVRLRKQFRKSPPEVMIFNDYIPSTREMFERYGDQYRTIYVVHVSPTYIEKFEDKITIGEILDLFSRADALVFVSENCRKQWLAYSQLSDPRTYYIPNSADEKKAKTLLKEPKSIVRERLEMEPDKFYLLSVASIQPRKGQDLLINAAPQLKKIAPNLEILIIGGGRGGYVESLKKRVEDENLHFVSFLGRKLNSMEYIYSADAFILTSRAEALPLVILEAMVLKTAVISSDVDGVPEMIEDRINGHLFCSGCSESLIETFKELYENEAERKQCSKRACEKYWDMFSNEHFANRYLNVIKSLRS
ncbi:MAG: glycosyltransferase family 4 protein [Balneolaceae bacterium]|nr:glycosyltransferase family 4 protein [Balneolaceae bacterium]MCH8549211.1 glycosyltransferase family 4 protein [Balneolaceae bacterium]